MDKILRNPGLRIHFIVYAAVNAGLLLINLMSTPGDLWFYWPLFGWGLGILGHALLVSRVPDVTQMAAQTGNTSTSDITAAEIDERARQLWEVHGGKAIAEAAEKARTSEAAGNAKHAETWRRIESALLQMRGPHAS